MTLYVLCGLTGVGKTTTGKALASRVDAVQLSSERVIADLFPAPTNIGKDADFSADELRAGYDEMFRRAARALERGKSVVMDGMFRSHKLRERAATVAKRAGARFVLVLVTCPTFIVRERVTRRFETGAQPGGFKNHLRLKREFEPPEPHHTIDTSKDVRKQLDAMMQTRCPWCLSNSSYMAYHDVEWGTPVHDDRLLFEFLVLEGMQAGLSWLTILKKRENFRKEFDGFDARKVARYREQKIRSLMKDAGIIRNEMKIRAAVQNARAFLIIQKEFGSFDRYIWGFVKNKPLVNKWKSLRDIPARTPLSDAISKDLKKRGFAFVGSTIIYAHMQATGMVNDHVVGCWRKKQSH